MNSIKVWGTLVCVLCLGQGSARYAQAQTNSAGSNPITSVSTGQIRGSFGDGAKITASISTTGLPPRGLAAGLGAMGAVALSQGDTLNFCDSAQVCWHGHPHEARYRSRYCIVKKFVTYL
jgi:hypothetical protein